VVDDERTSRLDLNLLSFLSGDEQTSQLHPIIGMPPLVPVPKNVNVSKREATYQIYIKIMLWHESDRTFYVLQAKVIQDREPV